MTRHPSKRHARVIRVNAKRPADIVVEIDSYEQPGRRSSFVDVLISILDARRHSRGV